MSNPTRLYQVNHANFYYDADKYTPGQIKPNMQKWIDENIYSYQSYAIHEKLSDSGKTYFVEIIVYDSIQKG